MNTKSRKEDDSLPYFQWKDPNGSIHYKNKTLKSPLSREEAFQAAQLEQLVERQSALVREYFLVRSSFSVNSTEKRAWRILYLLQRFVEAYGRFPTLRRNREGISELSEYLSEHLDGEMLFVNLPLKVKFSIKSLLGISPKRPVFQPLDNFQLKEMVAQIGSTLKRYIDDMEYLQKNIHSDLRSDDISENSNPNTLLR